MRGADGGPWRKLCALPALWAGLLYDDGALQAAWDLVKNWSMQERLQLRIDAPKLGTESKGSQSNTTGYSKRNFGHCIRWPERTQPSGSLR